MFIFRKISRSGVEMNFNLGDSYTLITRENNPEEFKKMVKSDKVLSDPVYYGFLSHHNGQLYFLSINQTNYIMTENGNTFANISLR